MQGAVFGALPPNGDGMTIDTLKTEVTILTAKIERDGDLRALRITVQIPPRLQSAMNDRFIDRRKVMVRVRRSEWPKGEKWLVSWGRAVQFPAYVVSLTEAYDFEDRKTCTVGFYSTSD